MTFALRYITASDAPVRVVMAYRVAGNSQKMIKYIVNEYNFSAYYDGAIDRVRIRLAGVLLRSIMLYAVQIEHMCRTNAAHRVHSL